MNFVELINPASLSNFNLIQGNAAGQQANLRTQALQTNALEQGQLINAINAQLEFQNAFRNQRSADPNQSLAGAFGSIQGGLSNPAAAIQAFNAQSSINQALLNQQAGQQNLALSAQLFGLGGQQPSGFGSPLTLLNSTLASTNQATRDSLSGLDFNRRTSSQLSFSGNNSTSAPERVSSNGARPIR